MPFTEQEEARLRQLMNQDAPLLSLAQSEPAIIQELGAQDTTIDDQLLAALPLPTDKLLGRFGGEDKAVVLSVLSQFMKGQQGLGLGSAAYKDVGTGSGQIPDISSFGAGSGWCQLPNGKLLQSGAYTGTAASGIINFPIPFPTTPGRVIISLSGTTTSTDSAYIIQDDNLLSRTSFSFRRAGAQSRFNWFCMSE